MAERKAVNKYYPPDWTPDKGSINKYVGQHPLRERAKKLGQGILVIRFELPYNIWCGGCGSHVGMGVRYNAEKKKVGNYYSTPIYRFRMKCHLCDNYFEIETDPKNCEYNVVSGARRKNETWEPSATETVETTDKEDAKRMAIDAMFKLEHGVEDVQKSKKAAPVLHHLQEIQSVWKDDYSANKLLRKKFREEKKNIADIKIVDDELRKKGSLDITLVPEQPEDIERAKKTRFYKAGFSAHKNKKRRDIEAKSWFDETSLNPLSTRIPGLSLRKRKSDVNGKKDEWKKSVLITKDCIDGTSKNNADQSEEKRPRLNSENDKSFGISNSEGHFFSERDREGVEKVANSGTCREEVDHSASQDAPVLVSTESESVAVPRSSRLSRRIVRGKERGNEVCSSRTSDKESVLTVSEDNTSTDKSALTGNSSSNIDGSSSLVSTLYSSTSSDDD